MAQPLGDFSLKRRSKINRAFVLSINPQSGLPLSVCQEWQRRSFSCLPPELSEFRNPKSKALAEKGAGALIDLLRDDLEIGVSRELNAPFPLANPADQQRGTVRRRKPMAQGPSDKT